MTIERLHTNDRMSQVVIHNDTVSVVRVFRTVEYLS